MAAPALTCRGFEREWYGDGVKDTRRFEKILQALQEDTPTCGTGLLPCVMQAKEVEGGEKRVIDGSVRVWMEVMCAHSERTFVVCCHVSHQFFRLTLRKYGCRVVDDDGATVAWHDKANLLPEDVWTKNLRIAHMPPTKSAAKT